jgi:hypothetical protein
VRFFDNATDEPRLPEAVATALRRTLQQDGTYRLNTQNEGDVIVSGKLISYERSGLSFQPRDVLTIRDFEIRLTAHVTAMERSTGKLLLDREVTGRVTLRPSEDFNSAERQAVPLLAADLAHNVASLLVDGTW